MIDIDVDDFLGSIEHVIYHLDYPAAGPGSFPQYMVSEAAARESKVILGGQGGDEIFGGYTRYLIAYFEQCIKAAIDGTMNSRQLRRHVRVDHPEPRRAAELQAAAEGVLARRSVRGRSTRATSG